MLKRLSTWFQGWRLVISGQPDSYPEVHLNNHHQNARTTFHGRVLMVQRVMEQGLSPRQVAQQFGVNVSTVYKWLRRYREGGRTPCMTAAHGLTAAPGVCLWSGWRP